MVDMEVLQNSADVADTVVVAEVAEAQVAAEASLAEAGRWKPITELVGAVAAFALLALQLVPRLCPHGEARRPAANVGVPQRVVDV